MKQFFGALFLLAAVVFLYKAGVLLPDLASAFGGLRNSYSPSYVPGYSLDPAYNEASYSAAASGYNYYPPSNPQYSRGSDYGAHPSVCYTNHMPIIDGVNFNYPIICNDPQSYRTPGSYYSAPTAYTTNYPAPVYPSYPNQYPSYHPSYAPSQPRTCY